MSATGKTLWSELVKPPSSSPSSPGAGFSIRSPLGQEDWNRLFALRWRILREPWGQPLGSERDDKDVGDQAYQRMAITAAGEVVGLGRLHLISRDQAQVRYMAVVEAWRGKGVGKAILADLEREAGRRGVRRVVLNAREEAVEFYARHGYRAVAAGETMFGVIRHTVMEKEMDR